MFRQILQQQYRLQDLEIQLHALERETEVMERERSSATVPSMTPVPEGELEKLEQRLRQNEADLMRSEQWEEQLQEELDREQGMCSNQFTFSAFFSERLPPLTFLKPELLTHYQQKCIDVYTRYNHQWMMTVIGSRSSKRVLNIYNRIYSTEPTDKGLGRALGSQKRP